MRSLCSSTDQPSRQQHSLCHQFRREGFLHTPKPLTLTEPTQPSILRQQRGSAILLRRLCQISNASWMAIMSYVLSNNHTDELRVILLVSSTAYYVLIRAGPHQQIKAGRQMIYAFRADTVFL